MTNRSRRGEPGLQRYESTWIRGIEREELRRGRLVDMVTGNNKWREKKSRDLESVGECCRGKDKEKMREIWHASGHDPGVWGGGHGLMVSWSIKAALTV
jgi:hypothetical protein